MLVASLPSGILAIAQLYRGRANCENCFDELKNQWGGAASPPGISSALPTDDPPCGLGVQGVEPICPSGSTPKTGGSGHQPPLAPPWRGQANPARRPDHLDHHQQPRQNPPYSRCIARIEHLAGPVAGCCEAVQPLDRLRLITQQAFCFLPDTSLSIAELLSHLPAAPTTY